MTAFFFQLGPNSEAPKPYLAQILAERSPGKVEHFANESLYTAISTKRAAQHFSDELTDVLLDGYFRDSTTTNGYSFDAGELAREWREFGMDILERLDGCFAAVIHDRKSRTTFLIRDRFGTKPLYYLQTSEQLFVASQVKSLIPCMNRITSDPLGVQDSIAFRCTPGTHTVYNNIHKVPIGSYVRATEKSTEQFKYFDLTLHNDKEFAANEWLQQTDCALNKSIALMAMTFSKVAVLLSGGVDSSLLLAYATRHFDSCTAFSLEIEGYENPELERAKYVANKLGVSHEIVKLYANDVAPLFKRVISLMEEPPRHFNNIPMLHLYTQIKGYDAILCGDAADAFFGSENLKTIQKIKSKADIVRKIPLPVRKLCSGLLSLSANQRVKRVRSLLSAPVDKLILEVDSISYSPKELQLLSELKINATQPSEEFVAQNPYKIMSSGGRWLTLQSAFDRNDRLSNPSGTELLYPFLSEPVVKIGLALPDRLRISGDETKPLLKRLCAKLVDEAVPRWTKLGFPSPEDSWIHNELESFKRNLANPNNSSRVEAFLGRKADFSSLIASRSTRQLLWWLMSLEECLEQYYNQKYIDQPTASLASQPTESSS